MKATITMENTFYEWEIRPYGVGWSNFPGILQDVNKTTNCYSELCTKMGVVVKV
jgi:hypothetical protein